MSQEFETYKDYIKHYFDDDVFEEVENELNRETRQALSEDGKDLQSPYLIVLTVSITNRRKRIIMMQENTSKNRALTAASKKIEEVYGEKAIIRQRNAFNISYREANGNCSLVDYFLEPMTTEESDFGLKAILEDWKNKK